MKTTIALFSILLLFLIAQSCKRETACGDLSDVVTTYNINDNNKAKIPYTGKDTLVFISDGGDTATLIGQGKKEYFETVRRNITGGDCPKSEVNNFENIEYNYIGNNVRFNYLRFKIYMYEKIIPTFPYIEILVNSNRILGSFQYIHGLDSISYNHKIIKGMYIDDDSTIVYNDYLGILKIQPIGDLKWFKIK